jgi:predicted alpha/beta-fold hydrolase
VAARIRRYDLANEPPFWARGGHAQTLAAHVLPSRGPRILRANTKHRLIEVPEGDRVLVFELPGSSGVRVHLAHGLSGDVNSEYMRRTATLLHARGHSVWAINHRGCGEGSGQASRPYHSGRSEDLQAVLAESRAEAPDDVHLVVGFSLSGNLALLHAAQQLQPRPDGIVAVNPPVDIERASVDIGRGLSRLYEMRFMWRLRRAIRERERAGLLARHYEISLSTTLREFDDLFTAPECGFADGLDYYRKCSSLPRLGAVVTPSVIVTAGDDPFVDPSVYETAQLPDSILLHVEPSGGHVGYLGRGLSRWLDGALVHYTGELAALALSGARPRPH